MNEELSKRFTAEEVHKALTQMHPSKDPAGLDGMPPVFLQNYWNIVGEFVTNVVLDALHSGDIPSNINHTFITLIPKKSPPNFFFIFARLTFAM